MITSLEPPDSYHLEAAQGWLELGNHREANEELEKIAPQVTGPGAGSFRYLLFFP